MPIDHIADTNWCPTKVSDMGALIGNPPCRTHSGLVINALMGNNKCDLRLGGHKVDSLFYVIIIYVWTITH